MEENQNMENENEQTPSENEGYDPIQSSAGESSITNEHGKPDNSLTLAIIGTVAGCCSPCLIGFILGIVAIVFSTQVDSKFNQGDIEGAHKNAKNAKILAYIAIGLGVLGLIINLVNLFFFGGLEMYQELLEEGGYY